MTTAWEAFVKRAIDGEPDEPFLRLLRQRLAAGYRLFRVSLADQKNTEYQIVLERLRELSEMRIPHSASFTRWSLGAGVKMASAEEEAGRFAILAAERYRPIAEELGAEYANAVFVDRIRAHAPPRTAALLANEQASCTKPGRQQMQATRAMDAFVRSLASDLGQALGYSEAESATILDGALARFSREHFRIETREVHASHLRRCRRRATHA